MRQSQYTEQSIKQLRSDGEQHLLSTGYNSHRESDLAMGTRQLSRVGSGTGTRCCRDIAFTLDRLAFAQLLA